MDPATADPAAQTDPATTGDPGREPGGAPFQEYLDRIPEEHRELVEPVFRDWDSATTRKFQEHATYRDQWAPFEQHGLHEYNPEGLAYLASLFEGIRTPEDYVEWLRDQATQAGLLGGPAGPDPGPAPGGGADPTIAQAVETALAPLRQTLDQLTGWQAQQDQWRQERELAEYQGQVQGEFETALAELQERHGEMSEETIAMLDRFTDRYAGMELSPREIVDRAWNDYQAFVGQIEQGVFSSKLSQPAVPATAGAPAAPTEGPQTMAEAHAVAAAHLRANRQQ